MTENIYPELKKIIKPYLPEDVSVDDIHEESHLVNDLNINSTHLVDIVLDVEDAFDITIEDEELEKMDTVKSSLDLISRKQEAQ